MDGSPDRLLQSAPGVLAASFDLPRAATVRREVAARVRAWGLDGRALDGFVLAVNEIMANAVLHGGGRGQLRLWREDTRLRCEVRDHGQGFAGEPVISAQRPEWSAVTGRGLWLARQYCDVDITSGPTGTVVLLTMAFQDPGPITRTATRLEDQGT